MERVNIYNRYIINYMKWKSKHINYKAKKKMGYFTQKDAKDIEKWDKKTAKIAWITLQTNAASKQCSDMYFCPVCIIEKKKSTCKLCFYGKRHKVCSDASSTYSKILTTLQHRNITAVFDAKFSIHRYLRNAQYRLDRELKQ